MSNTKMRDSILQFASSIIQAHSLAQITPAVTPELLRTLINEQNIRQIIACMNTCRKSENISDEQITAILQVIHLCRAACAEYIHDIQDGMNKLPDLKDWVTNMQVANGHIKYLKAKLGIENATYHDIATGQWTPSRLYREIYNGMTNEQRDVMDDLTIILSRLPDEI